MCRRKTHEQFVEELAIKRPDITILGRYSRANDKILFRFDCGHENIVLAQRVLYGSGCLQCRKKTTKSYNKELLSKRSDVVLIGEYINSSEKALFRFDCGHEVMLAPSVVLGGGGCRHCAHKKITKTHEEYVEVLAKKRPDVEVLEPYRGGKIKILHRFSCGHTHLVRPSNILSGKGCGKCKITVAKTQEYYVKELKQKRPDVKVIGTYINDYTKIEHLFGCGHITKVAPSSILQGSGCLHCSPSKPRTLQSYKDAVYILRSDVEVIAKEYINTDTPIEHKFSCGHIRLVCPSSILIGSGCGVCSMARHHGFFKPEDLQTPTILYWIGIYGARKIGITTKSNVKDRWKGHPHHVIRKWEMPWEQAYNIEQAVIHHKDLQHLRAHLEDLEGNGSSETFFKQTNTNKIVEIIESML